MGIQILNYGVEGDQEELYSLVVEEVNKANVPEVQFRFSEEEEVKKPGLFGKKGISVRMLQVVFRHRWVGIFALQFGTSFFVSARPDLELGKEEGRSYIQNVFFLCFERIVYRATRLAMRRFLEKRGITFGGEVSGGRGRHPSTSSQRPAGVAENRCAGSHSRARSFTATTQREAAVNRGSTTTAGTAAFRKGGGPEHTYLQELITRWAQERGFRSVIEEDLNGAGRVDVALYRDDVRIACEISVSTTPEHEAENVEKCLRASFTWVAVVSTKKRRLENVKKLLSKRLTPEDQAKVIHATPEELLSFLDENPYTSEEKVVAGYKVKVRYGGAQQGEKEKRIAAILAKSIKSFKS